MVTLAKKPKNKIATAVKSKYPPGFIFKPTQELYKAIGINQKRFGQLWRGEAEPLQSEIQTIATYFQIDIKELF